MRVYSPVYLLAPLLHVLISFGMKFNHSILLYAQKKTLLGKKLSGKKSNWELPRDWNTAKRNVVRRKSNNYLYFACHVVAAVVFFFFLITSTLIFFLDPEIDECQEL